MQYQKTIDIYQNGIKLHRTPLKVKCTHLLNYKRGLVVGFSRQSRLRLRLAMLQNSINNSYRFALTLTIPSKFDNDTVTNYSRVFHLFQVYFLRRFPKSALIYRHELQTRKSPHCHALVYIADIDYNGIDNLRSSLVLLWHDCLKGYFHYDFLHMSLFSCRLDVLDNVGYYRYICDHTSKSKQAQLGYKGRQWGIIGRSNFNVIHPDKCHVDNFTSFVRTIRRLSFVSRKSHKKSIFALRKQKPKYINAIRFCCHDTIEKLKKYYNLLLTNDEKNDIQLVERRNQK